MLVFGVEGGGWGVDKVERFDVAVKRVNGVELNLWIE
jgi:hypothetical protein